jgi:hypothetical protein
LWAQSGFIKKKYYISNVMSCAVLRAIWVIRNEFVFNKQVWRYVKPILRTLKFMNRMEGYLREENGRDDELGVLSWRS